MVSRWKTINLPSGSFGFLWHGSIPPLETDSFMSSFVDEVSITLKACPPSLSDCGRVNSMAFWDKNNQKHTKRSWTIATTGILPWLLNRNEAAAFFFKFPVTSANAVSDQRAPVWKMSASYEDGGHWNYQKYLELVKGIDILTYDPPQKKAMPNAQSFCRLFNKTSSFLSNTWLSNSNPQALEGWLAGVLFWFVAKLELLDTSISLVCGLPMLCVWNHQMLSADEGWCTKIHQSCPNIFPKLFTQLGWQRISGLWVKPNCQTLAQGHEVQDVYISKPDEWFLRLMEPPEDGNYCDLWGFEYVFVCFCMFWLVLVSRKKHSFQFLLLF